MKIIFLSGACIIHNKKTLILKQSLKARHPNLWGPPGGHLEGNETFLECAIREVKEETNLDIQIKGLVTSGVKLHKDGRISVLALYQAIPHNLKEFKPDPGEISDFHWASKNELEKDAFPLRDPLLKDSLIKSLNGKIASVDTFIYFK